MYIIFNPLFGGGFRCGAHARNRTPFARRAVAGMQVQISCFVRSHCTVVTELKES